jgi:hypothetical protein
MRTLLATGIVASLAVLAPAARAAEVLGVDGFEKYDLGTVVGQGILGGATGGPTWVGDTSNPWGSVTPQPDPDIIQDPTQSGRGKVMRLDPAGLSTRDWTGAFLPLGDLVAKGHRKVSISWDQYRTTLNQTIFVSEAVDQSGWFAYQYPLSADKILIHPNGNLFDPGLELSAGLWQSISVSLDYDTMLLSASIADALNPGGAKVAGLSFQGSTFLGADFENFATNLGAPNGPNYIDNLVVIGGTTEVPEPATSVLLTAALPMLAARRRKHA